ncbi:uncharacterized protein LOC144915778 isoform X1 [Branchiostoma floridae x Branchiostoma belcheri]
MSVFGMDEQLRIEQQKTDTGVVSSVNGWMNNGLPTGEQEPVKYNKDGKLVLDEQEVVCEDGRMVLEKCLQDEVMEVEDLGHLLKKPPKVQKKEEPVIKQEEQPKPRGGGMRIIIKGPFKVKHTAPSFIKEKKPTVQEAPPVETLDLDLRRKLVWEVDGQPLELEVPKGSEVNVSGSEFRPLWGGQKSVEEVSGLSQAKSGVRDGIRSQFEVVEEAEDSGVETTPTHQPKKHKLTLLSYEQEETLKWAMGSVRMPPYDIASWQHTDPLHRATESVTRSEEAQQQVSSAEEKVVKTPLEEVQGVPTNTKLDTAKEKEVKTPLEEVKGIPTNMPYSKPSYNMVGQDRYKALTRTVPSMQAVKLDTAEEKEVKTPLEEVKGVTTNTVYTRPSYNMVGQDRYKSLTRMVPSMQLYTAEEKEVKTSLDEVQGLVPKIAYSTPCYHTVRQDRYKSFSNLVPSAEAPSIKLNKGKEQKAHLRLVMKGGDLAPISWHKAAVAAVTQEYVKAKYSQVPSNQSIHIAKIQSAISDLESIKTHVEIAWNTVKPVSANHQYSKAKFSFTKSNSPVYFSDTQTAETKLEKSKVQPDLDWVKPELIPVAPHYYKTKSRFAKSQDPLYSGIQESMITVPQSVDDLAPIQKEKANVVDVSHKYEKAKSSQVSSNLPLHNAKLGSTDAVAESVNDEVKTAQYNKPEYEKVQQVVLKHNTNVVASNTAQYQQGNQKTLHLAEDEVEGIIEPFRARGCKFETVPQPYDEAVKYEITPSQKPTYQAKSQDLILKTEVVKENTDKVEFHKPAVELTGQTLFSHDTAITKSGQPSYHQAKKSHLILTTEVAKENTDEVEFQKPTVALTDQKLLSHDTTITKSGQPTYHEAKKNHLILTTEHVKEITDHVEFDKAAVELTGVKLSRHNTDVTKSKWRYFGVQEGNITLKTGVAKENEDKVEFQQPTVELAGQKLFHHDTTITKSGQPTYHEAKKEDLVLKTEVAKEDTAKVEFHKLTPELTGQKLFRHDTAITNSVQPSYHQAKKNHLILATEVAKESTDEVDFHKPTVAHTDQKLLSHDTAVTKSGKPTYHEAKKNHSILTTEYTKEITDRVEFDKAAVELSVVKLFRHNTAITKSKWRYFGVREGRITLQTEGVHGLDTNVKYETANVRKVEQELHTANKDEVLVKTADYFHTKPHRAAVPPLETLGVVEPLTYETASVQNVEAVFAKADQGEVTVEVPEYHTAITNSKFLTLSETKEDVTEIKYDTVTPQTVSEEPLHNVIVGEGKSEWHWLHAEEGELEELTFEKTRKLKPPIIESAVREIVDPQLEMPRPVFITNQAAVQAPLPTFTAKEVNSLPEWETCETFTVEEVTPVRAKASVAVMNVCRAQASQPRVQLAEEMPIVKVDAVQALSPPPKTRPGLFYVKPKEVQQPPLEEVGTIDDLNTESAKVSEEETPTLHKVTVTPVSKLKLELPKLEIREEEETITVDDLDLSPVTVVSPKPTQIHAKIQMEEPTEVQSQMHVSLQALPRPLLKQANEDSLEEIPLGSTLEIPELPYHKARTSMCPLLTSHRAGAMKLPIQRAPLGYNQDWRTLKRLEGLRASLMVNGETEAPYISRTSSVQSLNSQMSNDLAWTYADDKKPTEKEEKKEPSASPEKPSPPRPGSRKPLDDNTFKAPEEEPDAPVPPKDEPKAAPPKKGTAIQMVRELLGLPPKGKTQPEAKPAAPVTKETPPEPVVKETPAPEPVVKETPAPEPVVKETPAPEPVVKETPPEPVVKERPAPVVSRAPEPVVKEMPAPEPLVKETPAPEPLVKETPAPEPVVKETPAPEPVVKETPAPEPVVKETPAPEPVVKETPAPVKKAPEPITIGPPSAELPEPVDLPTTPIPSSMVVPSGPQKSPPAASSQPEKLGFWDSLRRDLKKPTAAAAAPDNSTSKPSVSDKESESDPDSNTASKLGRYLGFFKRDSERGREEKKDEKSPKRSSLFSRAPAGSSEPQ